jgi:hypothetical protein
VLTTTPKERPIRLYRHEVLGILNERQTQFRRVVKPQPDLLNGNFQMSGSHADAWPEPNVMVAYTPSGKFGVCKPPYFKCPYGVPGDRLWGRESGIIGKGFGFDLFVHDVASDRFWVSLDGGRYGASFGPANTRELFLRRKEFKVCRSTHMPRWASRITLEVVEVRVQRLQEIGGLSGFDDAVAEGVEQFWVPTVSMYFVGDRLYDYPQDAYAALWESIHGPGSWDRNPWVWAVTFKRVAQEGK